jgi:hypothetical protein
MLRFIEAATLVLSRDGWGLRRHLAACLGTAPASARAFLAVRCLVLRALLAARIACLRANPAESRGELRIPCHFAGTQGAEISATPVELDAIHHHLHVFFREAGGRAFFTRKHTGLTRIDTFLVHHYGGSFPCWI